MRSDDGIEPDTRSAERRKVLDRWARKKANGRVAFCGPNGRTKVIYDDLKSAVGAARELENMGSAPLEVYECNRSKRGHHHLRSWDKRAAAGRQAAIRRIVGMT